MRQASLPHPVVCYFIYSFKFLVMYIVISKTDFYVGRTVQMCFFDIILTNPYDLSIDVPIYEHTL